MWRPQRKMVNRELQMVLELQMLGITRTTLTWAWLHNKLQTATNQHSLGMIPKRPRGRYWFEARTMSLTNKSHRDVPTMNMHFLKTTFASWRIGGRLKRVTQSMTQNLSGTNYSVKMGGVPNKIFKCIPCTLQRIAQLDPQRNFLQLLQIHFLNKRKQACNHKHASSERKNIEIPKQ